MTLEEAVQACTAVTRSHSSTFYLGSRLFAGRERRAVTVIYAVCRTGDDAVDEAADPQQARRRLDAWWQGLERARGGRPRADAPLEVALAWVLEQYALPWEAFEELRAGLAYDISVSQVEDMDELLRYCRQVAGVVGLLVAPVAGYRGGDATLQQALALGQAMQLTNILRDVGEDLARGRCYLPRTRLRAHAVELEELRAGRVSENYVALLEELAGLTHGLYRLGWQGIPRLHGTAATAVGVAALNYEGILRKLRQNRYDNLTRRAYLRPLERLVLIPRALAGVVAGAAPARG